MLCYRDRMFCADAEKCAKGNGCYRELTPEMQAHAEKIGMPINWNGWRLECYEAKKEEVE